LPTHQPNPGASKWVGRIARRYDKMRVGKPGLIEDSRIVDAFLDTCEPGSTVVDMGAGTGQAVRSVLDRGLHYIGVDISADMIAMCEQKIAGDPRARAFVSDARTTPLSDMAGHYLISVRFVKWLSTDQMVFDALKEFRRVCQRRALINIKVPVPGKRSPERRSRLAYAIKMRSFSRRPRSSAIEPLAFEDLGDRAGWKVIEIIDNPITRGSRFYLLESLKDRKIG
jgi:ubiquinone/menaquinone biosynthesis C-methylase UbiE